MSEQAPVGDLGGEVVVESWHGLTRAEIEAWADERPSEPLYIDRLQSDAGDYAEATRQVEASISELLMLFGVDPDRWQDNALKLHRDNAFPKREEYKEYIQRTMAGKSAGKALIDWAEHNLKIEDQEDGMGTVNLVLALSDSVKASFSTPGDHWSGHHYRAPDDQSGGFFGTLVDKWDDDQIKKIRDEKGDDYLDSLLIEHEVGFLFDLEVRFMRPDNPNDVVL